MNVNTWYTLWIGAFDRAVHWSTYLVLVEFDLDMEDFIELVLLVLPFMDDVITRSVSGLSGTGGMTDDDAAAAAAPGSPPPLSPSNRSIGVAVFRRACRNIMPKFQRKL